MLAPISLESVVLAKSLAHWLTTGLPLTAAAPALALLLGLGEDAGPARHALLAAAMALGTPTLTLVGTIGAALALGARRTGVLLSLLVLPLSVPVLVFGAGAIEAAALGRSPDGPLMALAALLLAALATAPFAAAAALRQAAE